MRDPYQLASDLLTNVVSGMTALGSTLPTVQYVAPGAVVAYDGEQITTNILRLYAGSPGAESAFEYGQFITMTAELQVVIVRYTPALQDAIGGAPVAPSAADMQASAQQMLQDVQNLTQTLVNIISTNALGTRGMPTKVGPVTTEGPEGEVVATVGRLEVPLL